ncbi:uncharacterized protein N7477_000395 [Penicillium maclennaniae]|uniref:uncharacterized protein n=1 Tax=Penicillium maclennaniae TaxID=1343394 RepID=UPI00253FA83F|nr:uncharacterized protein N7477_000395 [Penicillium maclennaniae]KAJ5684050.1 hypothetical protein N7477_000395 [Penicillium maclennaniae]
MLDPEQGSLQRLTTLHFNTGPRCGDYTLSNQRGLWGTKIAPARSSGLKRQIGSTAWDEVDRVKISEERRFFSPFDYMDEMVINFEQSYEITPTSYAECGDKTVS